MGINIWLYYKNGHVKRKWFSSSYKAVAYLENHPEIERASLVLE